MSVARRSVSFPFWAGLKCASVSRSSSGCCHDYQGVLRLCRHRVASIRAVQARVLAGLALLVVRGVWLAGLGAAAAELRAGLRQGLQVGRLGIGVAGHREGRLHDRQHVHHRALAVGHQRGAGGEVVGAARHAEIARLEARGGGVDQALVRSRQHGGRRRVLHVMARMGDRRVGLGECCRAGERGAEARQPGDDVAALVQGFVRHGDLLFRCTSGCLCVRVGWSRDAALLGGDSVPVMVVMQPVGHHRPVPVSRCAISCTVPLPMPG